jgi:hypothetical protein
LPFSTLKTKANKSFADSVKTRFAKGLQHPDNAVSLVALVQVGRSVKPMPNASDPERCIGAVVHHAFLFSSSVQTCLTLRVGVFIQRSALAATRCGTAHKSQS